ncbi:MAG: hypothetical protein JXA67_14755 [Micromonosporaceae bacterium]|nr:hypothetical protein [Micromonosporaceae bacterium]
MTGTPTSNQLTGTTPTTTPTGVASTRGTGRGWAYLGVLLGGAVSIAANVAHSYVPPTAVIEAGPAAVETWQPRPGAVVGAVFWPIALFIAVEIFARIAWPVLRRWTMLRFGGLLPVALVAAIVSYRHLSGLLHFYGEDTLTTIIGPLAVDGLMIMASGALVATGASTAGQATRLVETSATADMPAQSRAGHTVTPGSEAAAKAARPVPTPTPGFTPRAARSASPLPIPDGAFTRANGAQLPLPGIAQ